MCFVFAEIVPANPAPACLIGAIMRWEGGEQSGNVEDRRGIGPAHVVGGGTVLLLLIGYFLGINPAQLLSQLQGGNDAPSAQVAPGREDRSKQFIATILGFTEKVWDEQFRKMGKTYEKPRLVIFDGSVQTGCGDADAAVGPFYCPADRTVYIDPAFFDELAQRFGGSTADFSQAYVIAHEIGHHVQTLLGYGAQAEERRSRMPREEFNRWSVRLELQADYLAGVWAHYGQEKFNFIESGDVEEALKSANAIGDDRLQQRATGRISPQNYTHGTSAQRVKWYRRGLATGDLSKLKDIFEMPYDQL
jgi:predicted metalloprotease